MEALNRLVYRRQYILSPEKIECPFMHEISQITDKYILYTHPDLVVSQYQNGERHLVLLGDIFDYENTGKGNSEILKDMSVAAIDAIPELTSKYTGRFVLILIQDDRIILLHDSIAYKKIYYATHRNGLWFCSHPHLLAKVLGLKSTQDHSKLEFYKSADFIRLSNSNLGDTTYFDEVRQLMPNHFFDVTANRIERYWPSKRISQLGLTEATERCGIMVKGYMESIANRYKIMLPVTSGYDSRLLMSGTKDYKNDVLYYINKEASQGNEGRDIRIPNELFKNLNLKFNQLILPTEIDKSFKKIFFENNPLASKEFLPHIYNYYLHYSDWINLPGNIASTPFGINNLNTRTVTIDKINKYFGIHKYGYANDYFKQWMGECQELCQSVNINVMNLYYWEEKMPNWGAQIALDKDIAQDEISPLNSRLLIETIFSVPLKYRNIPDKILHRKIIKDLWPELMSVPFNPSRKNTVFMMLASLGLFNTVSKLRYRITGK